MEIFTKNINKLLIENRRSGLNTKSRIESLKFASLESGCLAVAFFLLLPTLLLVKVILPFSGIVNLAILILSIPVFIFLPFYYSSLKDHLISIENRAKSLELAKIHLIEIIKILELNDSFILYLRDYKSGEKVNSFAHHSGGGGSGMAHPSNWVRTYGNERTTSVLSYFRDFDKPIIMLNNIKEKTLINENNALIFYPPDEIWIDSVKEFITKADFILIDFNFKKLTKSIKIEIENIIEIGRKNVIFIGNEKELIIIKKNYPKLFDQLFSHIIRHKYKSDRKIRELYSTGRKDPYLYSFDFDNLKERLKSSIK